MFNKLQQWLLKLISQRFSSVAIIMVLGFLCYYLNISASTIFEWYHGDILKLLAALDIGILISLVISMDLIMSKLTSIYSKVENHDITFSTAENLSKANKKALKEIFKKIKRILKELGNSSNVVILLIQQSIYLVKPSIDILSSQYLDLNIHLNDLQKQALQKHVDSEKVKFIRNMSYFVTRFFDPDLRTTMFNQMIKASIDKSFNRCYTGLVEVLDNVDLDYAARLSRVRTVEDQLVQDLMKGVLNIDYDMIDPKFKSKKPVEL